MKPVRRAKSARRHVIYVTGTRADFNLLLPTLRVIQNHPKLCLSVVATGMHVDRRFGPKLGVLKAAGIEPAAVVPWPVTEDPRELAEVTGTVTARLARTYRYLAADAILVLGDRVEAFAAASAAHLGRWPLAHIHGGDRAEGQVDDALRHAITQLAHLHLAASPDAVERIIRLGQRPDTVHLVGAPGVEHILSEASPSPEVLTEFPQARESALVLLHPTSPEQTLEARRAKEIYHGLLSSGFNANQIILLQPNNDPGHEGIRRAWESTKSVRLGNLPRGMFLGLLKECRVLVGNSSAGIIEAGSFSTPVINIGPRQAGRTAPEIVISIPYGEHGLRQTVQAIVAAPRPRKSVNPYYRRGTSLRIAELLAKSKLAFPVESKRLTY